MELLASYDLFRIRKNRHTSALYGPRYTKLGLQAEKTELTINTKTI